MSEGITQEDLDSQDIPNDNGKIKWYALGYESYSYFYLGEHTMTPDNWQSVVDALIETGNKDIGDPASWLLLRKDMLEDVMWNIAFALRDSGDFKKDWLDKDVFDDEHIDDLDLDEEVAR